MARAEERLVQWLRDAHAMEEQAEQMLSGQAKRVEHYPEMKAQIERHLEETRQQAEMLLDCLDRLDAGSSGMKDMTARMTAMGQNLSGMFAGDEVAKSILAWYTFEHFEIGSYRMLITAAEALGDAQTKQVCEQILRQEEAMATWLEQNMGSLTRTFLAREENPEAASKR